MKPLPSNRDENVDDVFQSLGDGEHLLDILESEEETPDDDADSGPRPPQFRLSSLFLLTTGTAIFCVTFLFAKQIGFLLFFLTALYWNLRRATHRRARLIPTLVFGGGASVTAGLMMASSTNSAVVLVGLGLACLGGYATIHGFGLAAALTWEGWSESRRPTA